ncbi:MAG: hypothetical protein AB7N71_06605 [Phycisphaerae bacterium]
MSDATSFHAEECSSVATQMPENSGSPALTDQLNTTFCELERFQDLLRSQVEGLVSRESAVAEQYSSLTQIEQEISIREKQIAEAEADLLNRNEALQQSESEADARRSELDNRQAELEQKQQVVEADVAACAARKAELDGAQAEIDAARAELEGREAAVAEQSGENEKKAHELDERAEALTKQAAQQSENEELLELRAAELDQKESELQSREVALNEHHEHLEEVLKDLESREEAMKSFQSAFQNIAAAFGGAGSLPAGMPDMSAFAKAAPPPPAPVSAAPAQEPAEQLVAENEEPVPHADSAFKEIPQQSYEPAPEAAALRESELEAVAAMPAPAAIDESSLDPEVLKKLRVMRRLGGGQTSDHDLLKKIYAEMDARPDDRGKSIDKAGKKKRGWWKN